MVCETFVKYSNNKWIVKVFGALRIRKMFKWVHLRSYLTIILFLKYTFMKGELTVRDASYMITCAKRDTFFCTCCVLHVLYQINVTRVIYNSTIYQPSSSASSSLSPSWHTSAPLRSVESLLSTTRALEQIICDQFELFLLVAFVQFLHKKFYLRNS